MGNAKSKERKVVIEVRAFIFDSLFANKNYLNSNMVDYFIFKCHFEEVDPSEILFRRI